MSGKRTKRKRELEKNERLDELLRNPPNDELDSPHSLNVKIDRIVKLIKSSKNVLFITGAGISTAANIPDYRGVEGLYTKNVENFDRSFDIRTTIPTKSHMIIKQMMMHNYISHLISQNCDGLHLRSGIPQNQLSEIHGNMYIEYCKNCEKQYIRPYEVSFYSDFRQHETTRCCNYCRRYLTDTIVHAGEKSTSKWPQNWDGAIDAAKRADLIIIIGTSGVVLKNYETLWPKKAVKVIVNTQPTVIDKKMDIVLRAKCDDAMSAIYENFDIDADLSFCRDCDMVLNQPRRLQYDKIMAEYTTCDCNIKPKQLLALDPSTANFGCPGWLKNGLIRMRRLYIQHNKESGEDSSSNGDDDDYSPNRLKKRTKKGVKILSKNDVKSVTLESPRYLIKKERNARLIEQDVSESGNESGNSNTIEGEEIGFFRSSNRDEKRKSISSTSCEQIEESHVADSPSDTTACLITEDCEQEVATIDDERTIERNEVCSISGCEPTTNKITVLDQPNSQEIMMSSSSSVEVSMSRMIVPATPWPPTNLVRLSLLNAQLTSLIKNESLLGDMYLNVRDELEDNGNVGKTEENGVVSAPCSSTSDCKEGTGSEKLRELDEEGENQKEGECPHDNGQTNKGDAVKESGLPKSNGGGSGNRSNSGSSGGSPNEDGDQPREPPKGRDKSFTNDKQDFEEEEEEEEDEEERDNNEKKDNEINVELADEQKLLENRPIDSATKQEEDVQKYSHPENSNGYGQFEFPMPIQLQPLSLPQISLAPVVIPTLTLPIRTIHPIEHQSANHAIPTISQLPQVQFSEPVQQVVASNRPPDPETPPARYPVPQFAQLNFDPLMAIPSSNASLSILNRLNNTMDTSLPSVSNANYQENIIRLVPPIIPPTFDLNQFLVGRNREMELLLQQQNQPQDNSSLLQNRENAEEARLREHEELMYLRENQITPPALLDPEARRNFVYDRQEDGAIGIDVRDNSEAERRQIVAEADSTVDNAHLLISVNENLEDLTNVTENLTENYSDESEPQNKKARFEDVPGPSDRQIEHIPELVETEEKKHDVNTVVDEGQGETVPINAVEIDTKESEIKEEGEVDTPTNQLSKETQQVSAKANNENQSAEIETKKPPITVSLRNSTFTEPDFDENFLEGDDDEDHKEQNSSQMDNMRTFVGNLSSIPGPSREPELTLLTSSHVGLSELRDDDMQFLDTFGGFDQQRPSSSFETHDVDIGTSFPSLSSVNEFSTSTSLGDFHYDYTVGQHHRPVVSPSNHTQTRNSQPIVGCNNRGCGFPSQPAVQQCSERSQQHVYRNTPGPSRIRSKEETIEETINTIVDRVTKQDVNELFEAVQGSSVSRTIANTAVFSRLDDYPILPHHLRNERQDNFEEVMNLVFSIYAPAFSLSIEEFRVFRLMFIERFGYTTGALQLTHIRNMIRHFKTDHCRK